MVIKRNVTNENWYKNRKILITGGARKPGDGVKFTFEWDESYNIEVINIIDDLTKVMDNYGGKMTIHFY